MIKIPTNCPECNSLLSREGPKLFCRNVNCNEVLFKKVQHFARTLGIKGLGPASIRKLGFESIVDIYKTSNLDYCDILGNANGNKIYREVQKTFNLNLGDVLPALSIPLIGKAATSKIVAAYGHYEEINATTLPKVIGPSAANNLLSWMESEDYILDDLPFSLKFSQPKSSKATVCITGRLKSFNTKAEAEKVLNRHGFSVSARLTKSVDILINEGNTSSSKTQDALRWGIPILTNIGELINE